MLGKGRSVYVGGPRFDGRAEICATSSQGASLDSLPPTSSPDPQRR
jgi:hypothetical protein